MTSEKNSFTTGANASPNSPSPTAVLAEGKRAMEAAGLGFREEIQLNTVDPVRVRSILRPKGDKDIWYVARTSATGRIWIVANDWNKPGQPNFVWIQGGKKLTRKQRDVIDAEIQIEREKREAAERIKHEKTAVEAQAMWDAAKPARPDHPYLVRKGVEPRGLRGGPWTIRWEDDNGVEHTREEQDYLYVPIYDALTGKLVNIQGIRPEKTKHGNDKWFLAGGKTVGCFSHILNSKAEGAPDIRKHIGFAEGYATAAAVHKLTGLSMLITLNAGNTPVVAEIQHKKYPERHQEHFADNDCWKPRASNPGLLAGITAVEQTISAGGSASIVFPTGLAEGKTDWDDLAQHDAELAKSQIEGQRANAEATLGAAKNILARADAVKIQYDADERCEREAAELEEAQAEIDAVMQQAESEDCDPRDAEVRPTARKAKAAERPVVIRKDYVATARQFLERKCRDEKGRLTLKSQLSTFYHHNGYCYRAQDDEVMDARLWRFLDKALALTGKKGSDDQKTEDYRPDKAAVANVLAATASQTVIGSNVTAPMWLANGENMPAPREIAACRNGLLHLPTGTLIEHTPDYWSHNVLGFDYQPDAPKPENFLRFLNEVWADEDGVIDADAEGKIDMLQELLGYLIANDTSLHKIALFVGPMRCGKGTIGKVMKALLGEENISAPTLSSMTTQFGLQSSIDKSVALVGDARTGRSTNETAVIERFLSISGEDSIDIDRKNKTTWTGRLSIRFVILSNEMPRLADATGALPSRFIVFRFSNSFLGREDRDLFDKKLLPEMPGILNWAIEGWKRLTARGHFNPPASSVQAVDRMKSLGSPVFSFVAEECTLKSGAEVPLDVLYKAWNVWREDAGVKESYSKEIFAKNLYEAFPMVSAARKRADTEARPDQKKRDKRDKVCTGITLNRLPKPDKPSKKVEAKAEPAQSPAAPTEPAKVPPPMNPALAAQVEQTMAAAQAIRESDPPFEMYGDNQAEQAPTDRADTDQVADAGEDERARAAQADAEAARVAQARAEERVKEAEARAAAAEARAKKAETAFSDFGEARLREANEAIANIMQARETDEYEGPEEYEEPEDHHQPSKYIHSGMGLRVAREITDVQPPQA